MTEEKPSATLIEPLCREHLERVCDMHLQALPWGFLPSLGRGFLMVLYQSMLELGLAFGYAYVETGTISGFIVGCADTGHLFTRLIFRRGPNLALAALPTVARRPWLIKSLVETFFYPSSEGSVPYKAELLAIVVDAPLRSRSIGRAMVEQLNRQFSALGISGYKVTVDEDNIGANNFYQRLGFAYRRSFVQYGRRWNLYTYSLDGA